MSDEREREKAALREEAKTLLVGGATLGTFSVVTTVIAGTTCPMCLVAAPVMLGAGAYKRWRLARVQQEEAREREALSPAD